MTARGGDTVYIIQSAMLTRCTESTVAPIDHGVSRFCVRSQGFSFTQRPILRVLSGPYT